MICDGYGLARNITGEDEGTCNDINIYQNSKWYHNETKYFGNGKILVDGIFRHTWGSFICSYPNPINEYQLLFNVMHILGRTMVEHVFGRQQAYWQILTNVYTHDLMWHGLIYRNTALLTNMLVIHQSPMRKK